MFVAFLAFLAMTLLYILSRPGIIYLGALVPLIVLAVHLTDDDREPGFFAKMFYLLAAVGLIPLVALIANYIISGQITNQYYFAGKILFFKYSLIIGISAVGVFAFLRYGSQFVDKATAKLTKTTDLERNKKTDVREIHKFIPKAIDFDPLKFLNKEKGVFLGLDEGGKPVYIPASSKNNAPHIQVIGTTGAGKGVSFGVMASQFLEMGEAIFFCDPKNDEWAAHVLYATAKRLGKPFHYIDLNPPHGAQFNIFQGATKEEIYRLFVGGCGLTERGGPSDFYNVGDRKAAKLAATELANGGTAASAWKSHGEELEGIAEKFAGKLRELAETPSINARSGGVDLAEIVQSGGVCYIVGSMDDDIVKTVQRMLLVRFLQLAARRDRIAGPLRPICVILDEVKYHISRPALEGLGAARDKGVHLVLAHQSLGDLEDCPADINPKAVVDAVVENCRIKVCYKVQNPNTAEWLAEMSGTILADDESRTVNKNLALAETVEGRRSIRQTERYFIDTNMLQNLEASTCVIFGLGLPKFATVKPILAPKSREAIQIQEVEGDEINAAEALEMESEQAERNPLDDPFNADFDDDEELTSNRIQKSTSDSESDSEADSESESELGIRIGTRNALDLD